MADFDPPWSSVGGVNRSPSTDEQADGFQCGEADLTLFNRLFGRVEAELKAIQDEGGIAGSESDDTTVLQAIQAMISAATGGGDVSQFVLFSQAQSRLPIFPEVTTNNGVIAVTDLGTGNIRIPASSTILHRGIRTYTTVQADIATVPSKTYHLRWNPTTGFVLKDLADTGYNPTLATESNAAFDSAYDDMLVARIVTNSSNVPTITNLANRAALRTSGSTSGLATKIGAGDQCFYEGVFPLAWSRTPFALFEGTTLPVSSGPTTGFTLEGYVNRITDRNVTRYQVSARVSADYREIIPGTPTGEVSVIAVA